MTNQVKQISSETELDDTQSFDFSYVKTKARIAVYDDLLSAPQVIEIDPAPTDEYIEDIASTITEQVKLMRGKIPYSAIREVTENFIHARFTDITVSILDDGNTVRFADQGPGIQQKEKAQLPGYTSAIEPMKSYIRGVGSGLPLVKEFLDMKNGNLSIEDNLNTGAVITLSLKDKPAIPKQPVPVRKPTIQLTDKEERILKLLVSEGALGNKQISEMSGIPVSTTSVTLKKMEQAHLIERAGKLRMPTDYGFSIIREA